MLVLGAKGFLGSAVARECLARGLDVRGIARRTGGREEELPLESAELREPIGLDRLFNGTDTVIHCAGLAHRPDVTPWEEFFQNNVRVTANVVGAARSTGVTRVVLVSSVAIYGHRAESPIGESAEPRPESSYARSKYLAEQEAMRIAESGGPRLIILRLATVYGKDDPGNVARLIGAIDRGRFLWVGDGRNRKSLIYREDAARACVEALGAPGTGTAVYNVSAPPVTMREIVTEIARALGRDLPGWRLPPDLVRSAASLARVAGFGSARAAALRDTVEKWLSDEVYDSGRFRRDLGFETRVTLSEGLRREVNWYRAMRGPSGRAE